MADANTLVALGLSHHTAPVDVREQLAMDEPRIVETLRRMQAEGVAREAFLLSTCNRVELYSVADDPDALTRYLPRGSSLSRYLYRHQGSDAVRHFMRVACSLDSLVVGEPQILGQVKDAVRLAEEAQTLGKLLHPLTQRTFSVAKRIRNETDIGKNRVGIGNAGVDLALQVFGGLDGKRAMLVGTGEMGRQVAQALLGEGLAELLVTSRTDANAKALADQVEATAVPWDRLGEYLARVDIAIVATGSRTPVLTGSMVYQALKARRWRPIFLIDLSVPRNVAPDVDELEEAFLFNIDHLEQVVAEGQKARAQAARSATAMVDDEAVRFVKSLSQIHVGREIGRITKAAELLRLEEMERSRKLLEGLDEDQQKALDAMTRALVKKMLHGQIHALREAAKDGDGPRLEAIKGLWSEDE